jgi:hypothetical protein
VETKLVVVVLVVSKILEDWAIGLETIVKDKMEKVEIEDITIIVAYGFSFVNSVV